MRILLVLVSLLGACGGDALNGTWKNGDGTLPLPQSIGGAPLPASQTVVFNGNVSPKTFDMTLALTFSNGSDTVEATGTYTDAGDQLTLNFTSFVVGSTSGDITEVASDGSQCVKIHVSGDLELCVKTPQTNSYTISGGILSTNVVNTIGGTAGDPIPLNLTKS